MTPEQHNRLRGQALTILAMDIIREQHEAGNEVSAWSITRIIADRHGLQQRQREQLRSRIYDLVRQLEASALITCTMRWNAKRNVHIKLITPCSVT